MKENKMMITDEEHIQSLIYEVRKKTVMMDSDVANLYGYETRVINQTVKRNIKRFPEEFCFRLSKEEYEKIILRSQNVISKQTEKATMGGRRYQPFVFTEQGIAMLAGLLKNDIAIDISINIINAFVHMRKIIVNNEEIFRRLTIAEYKLLEHEKKFAEVFDNLQKENIVEEKVFFNGQIYDSYSLLVDIIQQATKNIIIIDGYVDKTILDLLAKKKKNVNVKVITYSQCELSDLDIIKFNQQYPFLKMEYSRDYHDRFIIIDSIIYHCGASFKDLGKKCFAISKMTDQIILSKLTNSIEEKK